MLSSCRKGKVGADKARKFAGLKVEMKKMSCCQPVKNVSLKTETKNKKVIPEICRVVSPKR